MTTNLLAQHLNPKFFDAYVETSPNSNVYGDGRK